MRNGTSSISCFSEVHLLGDANRSFGTSQFFSFEETHDDEEYPHRQHQRCAAGLTRFKLDELGPCNPGSARDEDEGALHRKPASHTGLLVIEKLRVFVNKKTTS